MKPLFTSVSIKYHIEQITFARKTTDCYMYCNYAHVVLDKVSTEKTIR